MKQAKRSVWVDDPAGWPVKLLALAILLMFWVSTDKVGIEICVAQEKQTVSHILYINSYHPGYSWSDNIEKGLRDRFNQSGRQIELSVEYLDTRRFPEHMLRYSQADILFSKYREYRHDLVIVSDNAAFEFAIKYRKRLFPDTPLVFCGYNAIRPDILQGLSNITGVNEEIDLEGLIDMALHIDPQVNTLVFIISTADVSSKVVAEKAETSIFPKFGERYDIVALKDASMAQIREALARIPDKSALFLIGQTSDMGEGRALTPIENGRLISAASPVPVYTLWEFHLDTGVLGGRILSGYDQGQAAADMALEILAGKRADSIPVLMESPTEDIFDYKVMRRFKLSPDSLPDGSVVINKPSSFYTNHKALVWSTSIVFSTLVALIIALSLNIHRRLRVEKELQEHRDHLENVVIERTADLTESNKALIDSEERFRSLSDAAFEGIVFSANGIVIEANDAICTILGYAHEEIIGKAISVFVPPQERANVQGIIQSGLERSYESQCLKKDGSVLPIKVQAKMFAYKGRNVRVTAIRDLSEQKKAEEEIKTLRGILPICAKCKKIRDDHGYWKQIEAYIEEHSDAAFSHGICKECAKELYPQIDL